MRKELMVIAFILLLTLPSCADWRDNNERSRTPSSERILIPDKSPVKLPGNKKQIRPQRTL